MRFIHMAFVKAEEGFSALVPPHIMGGTWVAHYRNVTLCFAICSNLVDDSSVNALIVMGMTNDCRQIMSIRHMPLTTQDCCCHRIAVLSEGLATENWSVVISELASSKVFQIKLANLIPVSYTHLTLPTILLV